MLDKLFETLGINSLHRDPAPPMVSLRHQPKRTEASTVRNRPRPDRSPIRAPIGSEIKERDPATVVGFPALKPGNATDLGRAAHRSLTKRSVLPEAIADTIGGRLFPQTALTTTAAGPQAFVVLGVKALVNPPPSTDRRLPHELELELMRTQTQLLDGPDAALVHTIDPSADGDRSLRTIVGDMLRRIYQAPQNGVNKACVTVERTLASLTWD